MRLKVKAEAGGNTLAHYRGVGSPCDSHLRKWAEAEDNGTYYRKITISFFTGITPILFSCIETPYYLILSATLQFYYRFH